MYSGLIGMITGSLSRIIGPVGVAQMTSQAAHLGLVHYYNLLHIEFELRVQIFANPL
ncbi:MAG: hypothetical protein ACLUFR_06620 [Megamonas funiformis]|uniref:hypothetical protein n=1 Tax=Megamonas funiformis TaxID=437897 RepID=UPI003994A13B